MYQEYKMAEFYYENSIKESNFICGELIFFEEGEFIKTDTICNLRVIASN